MYFGGCYLGRHLQVLGGMQRKAVEQEILGDEIERSLRESADIEALGISENVTETQFKELIGDLAQEFNRESSFGRDEEGYLKVTLESVLIVERFKELVGRQELAVRWWISLLVTSVGFTWGTPQVHTSTRHRK